MKKNTNTKEVKSAVRAYIFENYSEPLNERPAPADFTACARYIADDMRDCLGAPVTAKNLTAGASPAGFELPMYYADAQNDLAAILGQTPEEAAAYAPADSYKLLAHLCAREINAVLRK